MKNSFESKTEISVVTVTDDKTYRDFLDSGPNGLAFIPESYRDSPPTLKADSADFAKWIKQKEPNLTVTFPGVTPKLALHGADVWLPLIYLAGDTSMPVLLNLVSSYLYDRFKGNLPSDASNLNISAVYQSEGITKKFDFSGDLEAFNKVSQRFNLKNFYDETAE